ncbi:transcriptional regulator [Bordetella pertussis]|nr:transcriptional regulator [Bordetella pertussis]
MHSATTGWRGDLESRALDLLVEGFDGLEAGAGAAPQAGRGGLARRDFLRMARIRELLESGEADAWSLEELARHACLSVNTLQRHFRAAWGMTVFECLRGARLTRARLGLERDGLSVAQAACLAGYTSAANFATAFRRAFGVTPGQLRARR